MLSEQGKILREGKEGLLLGTTLVPALNAKAKEKSLLIVKSVMGQGPLEVNAGNSIVKVRLFFLKGHVQIVKEKGLSL